MEKFREPRPRRRVLHFMGKLPILAGLLLAACTAKAPLAAPEPLPPAVPPARPERPGPLPTASASGSAAVERELEIARGAAALQRVRAAPSSVVAVFYQGMPRPVTGPDGRTTFAGPAVNAVVREDGRWLGWRSGRAEPLGAATAARLDALLDDPALWREPDEFPRGSCTDAGSLQLVIRHRGRFKSGRQDNCDSRGLSGQLGRLVLDQAPSLP